MYRYYNAHPLGRDTDDCVKRAIAIAAGMPYAKVQRELNRYKKVTGAETFNSHYNPHRYVEEVLQGKRVYPGKTVSAEDFCRAHPVGRFILDMPGHWSCCVDGVIYDTWDCGGQKLQLAYELPSSAGEPPLRYCCTARECSATHSQIRIYDGLGSFVTRKTPTELVPGYIRCLEDQGYCYAGF